MPADIDVFLGENGLQADGSPRPWALVKVRARTVFGNLAKKKPFVRRLGMVDVATTPSQYDHDIGTAEVTAWRYVASDGVVYDHKDALLVLLEDLIERQGVAGMQALIAKAKVLRPWPPDYEGAPDFER
jgi:hypothetical protein